MLTKTLILLALLCLINISHSNNLKQEDCSTHKIYCHIKILQPLMDDSEAMKLSNLLFKYSKMYGTDPYISVAICMVETSCTDTNRMRDGMYYAGDKPVISKVITDVGLFQLHVSTIKYYKLNIYLLLTDFSYYVEQHVKLLAIKTNECFTKYGITAWACYHSKTAEYHYKYYNKAKQFL